jgi:hypothetical protein
MTFVLMTFFPMSFADFVQIKLDQIMLLLKNLFQRLFNKLKCLKHLSINKILFSANDVTIALSAQFQNYNFATDIHLHQLKIGFE